MAGTAASRGEELARVRAKEHNNYRSGLGAGAKVPIHKGPASRHGVAKTNPTSKGGINRSTRGMG